MDKIITAREAAEILGVSRARVYALLTAGRIGDKVNGISYEKTIKQRDSRKQGRPEGSYKVD